MSDEPYYTDEEIDEMVADAAELRKRPQLKDNTLPRPESPGKTEMGSDPCPLCGEPILSLSGHLPQCDER